MYEISIIIPCYNCEKYITRCIESVLTQSFREFELILINDGSTDKTEEICLFFAEQYDNVKYYSHENQGVSITRKRGVLLAQGKYIAFVDSDDYLEIDYLETLYSAAKYNECEVVCCNSLDEANIDSSCFIKENTMILTNKISLEAYLNGERYAYCIWGKLIATNLLVDLKFPNMKYSEDAMIVQKVFSKAKTIQLLCYAGYHYTDNPVGAMNTASGIQQPMDIVKCDTYIMEEICKNYSELIPKASIKFRNDMFSLLINASIERGINKRTALEVLDTAINLLPLGELLKSYKGVAVYSYTLFPKFVLALLFCFSKIKHGLCRGI